MDDEVEQLSKILLEPVKDYEGVRAEAAVLLGEHLLDIKAFNALYSICSYPDKHAIEDGLLPIVGESIGKIISARDLNKDPMKHHKFDPKYFDAFHPEALDSALSVLTDDQREQVYEYTVESPHCSDALSLRYYWVACERAMELQTTDRPKAARNAINAINFFKRFKDEEKDLYLHFKDIIMNIIAGEANVTIVPLFLNLIKNYRNFNPPETEFEKYSHFHIILITKLVCSEYTGIQNLFKRLKDWVVKNLPDDEVYIQVMEMIVRGDVEEAYRAIEKIRKKQLVQEYEKHMRDFYHAWYLATSWLIKERLFGK